MTRIFRLLAAVLFTVPAEAQVSAPEVHHVRWPLLDIVLVPDSASIWILAGPNFTTRQWENRSHLVDFSVDPALAFQWVTVARRLAPLPFGRSLPDTAGRITPPLKARQGHGYIMLGTNPKKPSAERSYILLVSDSSSRTHWTAFASAAQVDSLLTALEVAASSGQLGGVRWNALACQKVDTPVRIISQRAPEYPPEHVRAQRRGRVWMTYVVNADGRPDPDSFWPVLSDGSLFTRSAIDALRHSRFKPAITDGAPVPQRVFQAVVFREHPALRYP